MLSKKQVKKYLKTGANNCPHCKSDEIASISPMEFDSDLAWQDIGCNKCSKVWTEQFKMNDIYEGEI